MALTKEQARQLRAFIKATDARLLALLTDPLIDADSGAEAVRLETLRGTAWRLLATAKGG